MFRIDYSPSTIRSDFVDADLLVPWDARTPLPCFAAFLGEEPVPAFYTKGRAARLFPAPKSSNIIAARKMTVILLQWRGLKNLLGRAGLAAFVISFALAAFAAHAQQTGKVSGLPLPRFVSLKSDRVNLREGPSKDHRTTWVFERAGLPVEITAEFDTWRKVRDSEGTEGWVLHSLLSGRRTALVAPWRKDQVFTLYAKPSTSSGPTARLQPGVIANIKTCDGSWCQVFGDGFEGYIEQTSLWGVYQNEKIE
jgi:SH3-like domain-containing protein